MKWGEIVLRETGRLLRPGINHSGGLIYRGISAENKLVVKVASKRANMYTPSIVLTTRGLRHSYSAKTRYQAAWGSRLTQGCNSASEFPKRVRRWVSFCSYSIGGGSGIILSLAKSLPPWKWRKLVRLAQIIDGTGCNRISKPFSYSCPMPPPMKSGSFFTPGLSFRQGNSIFSSCRSSSTIRLNIQPKSYSNSG